MVVTTNTNMLYIVLILKCMKRFLDLYSFGSAISECLLMVSLNLHSNCYNRFEETILVIYNKLSYCNVIYTYLSSGYCYFLFMFRLFPLAAARVFVVVQCK